MERSYEGGAINAEQLRSLLYSNYFSFAAPIPGLRVWSDIL